MTKAVFACFCFFFVSEISLMKSRFNLNKLENIIITFFSNIIPFHLLLSAGNIFATSLQVQSKFSNFSSPKNKEIKMKEYKWEISGVRRKKQSPRDANRFFSKLNFRLRSLQLQSNSQQPPPPLPFGAISRIIKFSLSSLVKTNPAKSREILLSIFQRRTSLRAPPRN